MEAPKKFHDLSNPGEYWLGRVVSRISDEKRLYGHIIGLYRTNMGEVGVDVQWEGGEKSGVHYANLDLH